MSGVVLIENKFRRFEHNLRCHAADPIGESVVAARPLRRCRYFFHFLMEMEINNDEALNAYRTNSWQRHIRPIAESCRQESRTVLEWLEWHCISISDVIMKLMSTN